MNKTYTPKSLALLLLLFSCYWSMAQTNTFTYSVGPNFNNWNAAGNWSLGHVPTLSEDVVIPTGGPYTPRIFAGNNGECGTLTLSGSNDLALEGSLAVLFGITHSGSGNIFVERNGGKAGALYYSSDPAFYYNNTGSGKPVLVYDQSNTNAGYRDLGPVIPGLTVSDINNGSIVVSGQDNVDCYYSYSPYPTVQYYKENHTSLASGDWNERWVSHTGASDALVPGVGYAVRRDNSGAFSTNQVGASGSTFNYGDILVPVSKTVAGNGQGWNLLSNPYPTYLGLDGFLANNSIGSAYVFSTTGQFTGNWASCNSSGVTSGFLPSRYIAPGQGFFVQVPSSGTVSFNHTYLGDLYT